ncbi:hypothetical protein HDV05_000736 [Chytridiales sp. JEL 0842]|nr:hypothetical protein HDV05_000736 [Chytridiales sp. JEL 0842]
MTTIIDNNIYNPPRVEIFYDVVCPWAYLGAVRIQDIADRYGAQVIWKPVLLGGIYRLTSAPQGAAGSASDVMPAAKKLLATKDLRWAINKHRLPINWHPNHPVKSVSALRLLHALPETQRGPLTQALYQAYWVQNLDISDHQVLLSLARKLQVKLPEPYTLDESLFSHPALVESLTKATSTVVELGAPGVPFFHLPDLPPSPDGSPRCFWGQDRLHFVESSLSTYIRQRGNLPNSQKIPWTLFPVPQSRITIRGKPLASPKTLEVYWDFSSPWSYLGWTQLERFQQELGPLLKIVNKPLLVGALFKEIGTPNLPMVAMPPIKRAYYAKDMLDWIEYFNKLPMPNTPGKLPKRQVTVRWPDIFPIRSVLSCRVALVEPKVTDAIFKAAWEENVNIADADELVKVLNNAGFDGPSLVAKSNDAAIKAQLRANGERAVALGMCGVPSYAVNVEKPGDEVVFWGQDRMDQVLDALLLGSEVPSSKL